MERTVNWFQSVLGWHGEIVEKDKGGQGTYGYVFCVPPGTDMAHFAPSSYINLFAGEPVRGLVAFMFVHGIEALHNYVISKGWRGITQVKLEPWGARTCEVETPDGCILWFFEPPVERRSGP
jgi:catechol 2,3-dioxygenase-like lactoylglutathione lyase family enzyme